MVQQLAMLCEIYCTQLSSVCACISYSTYTLWVSVIKKINDLAKCVITSLVVQKCCYNHIRCYDNSRSQYSSYSQPVDLSEICIELLTITLVCCLPWYRPFVLMDYATNHDRKPKTGLLTLLLHTLTTLKHCVYGINGYSEVTMNKYIIYTTHVFATWLLQVRSYCSIIYLQIRIHSTGMHLQQNLNIIYVARNILHMCNVTHLRITPYKTETQTISNNLKCLYTCLRKS